MFKVLPVFVLVSFILLPALSCTGTQKRIGDGFRTIAEIDMAVIVKEISDKSPSSLLARPYYRVVEYQEFPESRVFTHKAVVEYYYMDSILIKQVRKYRYQPSSRVWDRYDKQIRFILDSKG
ncbi:MAG: hypothetical protein JNL74_09060 [Fibrobacteres bacterium]|nr:hypothetical protein [Fibrobacterota bacterium]